MLDINAENKIADLYPDYAEALSILGLLPKNPPTSYKLYVQEEQNQLGIQEKLSKKEVEKEMPSWG
eukprot:12867873-Ditylum_brightwellii.AAC.1